MKYLPIALAAVPLLLAGCGSSDGDDKTRALLVINTDRNASELSWTITNSRLEVVTSGSGYDNSTLYEIDLGFDDGGYRIDFHDAGNDGLCCGFGEGNIELRIGDDVILNDSGDFGEFTDLLSATFVVGDYVNRYEVEDLDGSADPDAPNLSGYYADADLLDGYLLKTALSQIISAGHNDMGYGGLWDFYAAGGAEDSYYESDGSILDIYSEVPNGEDPYNFVIGDDQCGNYSGEGDCYNREHIMPQSWFDRAEPMRNDVHHVFATDGYVNGRRGSLPFGEIGGEADYASANGSLRGSGHDELGYSQLVFEPIDEFKGDVARAFFYMATRYEADIVNEDNHRDDWYAQSDEALAVFQQNSSDQVYRRWVVELMMRWHEQDPVSEYEIQRNASAFEFQGNRNPYIDHPDFVEFVWGHEGFDAAEYHFN